MVSHHKRHQRIYVTNQLMDNFYVLSGILIVKCSFQVSCQFNAKPGAIEQLTLTDQPVNVVDCWAPLVYFSVWDAFLLVTISNILPQVLCSQPLLKDSLSL